MRILQVGHGYVGAFLAKRLVAAGHELVVCDATDAGTRTAPSPVFLRCRYQDLRVRDLEDFDAILWFAGHSSVPMSLEDPLGALGNNCLDLLELAKRKPSHVPLIYASTASVYSVEHRPGDEIPPLLDESETRLNPVNPYDCSKIAFDALASCFTSGLTGLRLGTVCGVGPKLRPELLFNAMNLSALRDRRVRIANAHAWRAILFLDDLADVVESLLAQPGDRPPIINVASCNTSIGDLGRTIAAHYGVEVETLPDSRTYSFRMDCSLAERLCGPTREASIEERCRDFARDLPHTEAPAR